MKNTIENQYKAVKEFFTHSPATMKQCSEATGVDRANICRFVALLRDSGLLKLHHVGVDCLTGHKAGFFIICNNSAHADETRL